MARLIEKRKGYNTYLNWVSFEGYGLNIHLSCNLHGNAESSAQFTILEKSMDVTGREVPKFFCKRDLNTAQVYTDCTEALKQVRYLAEKCVEAGFTLTDKAMIRVKVGGVEFIPGGAGYRDGVRETKKRKEKSFLKPMC